MTDHVSTLLFCPSRSAMDLLAREGLADRARFTGDVMLDTLLQTLPIALERSTILGDHGITRNEFVLTTIHRPRNTDDPLRLRAILSSLAGCDHMVVLPCIREPSARWSNTDSSTTAGNLPTFGSFPPPDISTWLCWNRAR